MIGAALRILLIGPGYPPTIGGIELVMQALAEHLARRGDQVEVLAYSSPAELRTAPRRELQDGVVVQRFAAWPDGQFRLSPSLWRSVRSAARRADVVHVHGYHSSAALAVLLTSRATPLVFSPHFHGGGHTTAAKLAHIGYTPLGRSIMRRADRIVAVSRYESQLLSHFAPRTTDKTTVVLNGVRAAEIAAASPWPQTPPTVLVLGRLEPHKRVDAVIRAFARLSDGPLQLVVIGDGPDRARLERVATASDARRVRFLGSLPRDDVNRWLATARCLVSWSEREAFGLVGLEAAAAGTPAVLSDIPAHREVGRLAGGLVTVCAEDGLDRALHAALSSPERRTAVRHDWSDVVHSYRAVYRELVAGGPAPL